VAVLATDRLVALTTTQMRGLTTAQIVNLTTTQAAALTSTFVNNLSYVQIRALETADLSQLTSSTISSLTTTQLSNLTSSQVSSLTTIQTAQLTSSTLALLGSSTPLILDLNGDGIKTLSINTGVKFDILANGSTIQTGWVGPQDGLLVSDRNNDGVINDGSELFGSSTVLANGQKAVDGYQALAQLDSNSDGVINQQDSEFGKLSVWVDANSDGLTETGELKSLSELGITQLNVNAQSVSQFNEGNLIGLTSTYQTNDGQQHISADVWFVVDKNRELTSSDTLASKSSGTDDTNLLAKAISEFKDTTLSSKLDVLRMTGEQMQPSLIQSVAINANRLADVLKEYQLSTVGSALGAIQNIGNKSAIGILSMPFERSYEQDKPDTSMQGFVDVTFKPK